MTQYEGDPIEYYEDEWTDFCAWLVAEHSKQNTIDRWRRGSKKWFNWCGDHGVDPRTVETPDVEDFLDDHPELASNSRQTTYMAVMRLYDWWRRGRDGITLEHNPCADLDISDYTESGSKYVRELAQEGKSDKKALSKGTVEALFPYAADEGARTELRNETLLRLAWDTAARTDELERMRVERIDWDDQYISIRSSKLDPDQDLFRRRVFFSPTTKRYLDLWCNGGRESLSSTYADSEYLWISQQDPQLESDYISRLVKEAAFRHDADPETDEDIQYHVYNDAAGKPRWLVTGHRLRVSRITHLANETPMEIHHIRMMAGHERLETTMGYVVSDWDTAQEDYHNAVDGK